MFRNLLILLSATTMLAACSSSHSLAMAAPKTPEDYKVAHDYAEKLVPLTMPKLASSDALITIREKMHESMQAAAEKAAGTDAVKQCFNRTGTLQVMGETVDKQFTPERVRTKLADEWTDHYTTLQLHKFYDYFNSPLVRRLNSYQLDPKDPKGSEQELIASGQLSKADLEQLRAMTDGEIAQFSSAGKAYLTVVLTQMQKEMKVQMDANIYQYVDAHREQIAQCGNAGKPAL
jgi:hypothetical protein